MEKHILLILAIITLVGVVGLIMNSTSLTGAAFLSDRLCKPGYTSMLYVEKYGTSGYFQPTVVCVEGDQVPNLRQTFKFGENNAERYDKFRSDPYRFRQY